MTILTGAAVVAACGQLGESSGPREGTPMPASYFDRAITLELKAPSEVHQGERLKGLDVVMTNQGEEPFTFYYSGNLLDFEVLDGEGDVVWRYLGVSILPLGTFTLVPRESKAVSEFHWTSQGQWDLRDREGFPVGPGEYQVRGVVTLHLQDPAEDQSEERLETAPHTLTVHEAPLPDYAQAIALELTAPPEARSGEPVPIDLRITNTGDEPLVLWWSGHNQIPRSHHSDIVIFQDGKPIWRAIDAYDVRASGIVTLGPGESQAMSSIPFLNQGV
jgi:hypothetical protein